MKSGVMSPMSLATGKQITSKKVTMVARQLDLNV